MQPPGRGWKQKGAAQQGRSGNSGAYTGQDGQNILVGMPNKWRTWCQLAQPCLGSLLTHHPVSGLP